MCSSNSNTNSNNTSTNNNSKRKLQQILPIPSKNSNININSDTNINKDSSNSLPLKTKKKYNKKRKLLSNKSNYIPSVTTKIINKNPPEFQDQPKPRHLKSCSRCLTCELEIVIPIKRSNIIKNLSDNIDDLKLKVDELLSNHIVLQKKCIEKGLKIDGLLDINTINYFESQNNTTNLLEFNMEEDDDDNDDDDDIDTAVPDQESERENSVAEDEEEEEQQKQSKETANDNIEIKLPTSTSMINSNTRSNSTNKLFSPVSTATSLSSDEDENEMEKLSINEEFEKDECGFIKSDYSIDEINYIKNINNNNNNNEKLNQFNLIINNSFVKSISLNNVLNYFKIFNNNYINLLLSIIKPIKDPNYYFKNFNLKFWIIILICERKFLNIELFNYIKLKLNELLLINNTNNYSNDLNNNKNSLNIELIESIIILTTYSVEFKIDDDLTYYNWLLNLKNIYSIDSNRFNSDSNSDSNSSSSPI
ncbi:unnamed protein product [[Candida] boidinii]|nr:unnamed protein product [[Candida] boidinii]